MRRDEGAEGGGARASIIYPARGEGSDGRQQHRDLSRSGRAATAGPLVSTEPETLGCYGPGCLQRVGAPATGPRLASNPCPSPWLGMGMGRSVILWVNPEVVRGFFLENKMTEMYRF